jgi:integrase
MYVLPAEWERAVAGWLVWMTAAGAPATTRRQRRGHIRWVARNSGTSCPAEVTTAVLVQLCSGAHWSNEHRRGVRRSLIMFYEWAVEHETVSHNPALALPKVSPGKPRPRPCPDEIWRQILAVAPPREQMMVRLAGEVGMRRAEVARCHHDDLIRDAGGWSLIVHGKGDKQRVVPITDRLAAEIEHFCRAGYLFPGQDNGHLSAHYVGKVVSALMPHGWSMHKLRHRYATRGLAATGDLLAVRDALGHTSVATTQIYTAITSDKVRRVAEAAADDAHLGCPV